MIDFLALFCKFPVMKEGFTFNVSLMFLRKIIFKNFGGGGGGGDRKELFFCFNVCK